MERDKRGKFVTGNTGGGRKSLPDDIKAARAMAYEDMCKTVIEVRSLTPEAVKELDMDKEPLGKRAILNAYVKLDYRGIKDYEDRLFGKATDNIDLKTSSNIILNFDKELENI